MPEFRIARILVATDFSEIATRALAYATELAKRTSSGLVVVYADTFLPPPIFTSTQLESVAEGIARSKEKTRVELDKYVAANVGDGVRYQSRVIEDYPASGIVKTADEVDADVIVMGTHGRSGLNRMMLGSVAERVLRMTSRPLLTVRAESPSGTKTPNPRILCPVNCSDAAREALDVAIALAETLGGELTVLHVVEDDSPTSRELVEKVEAWIPVMKNRPTMAKIFLRGDAAEQVIEHARKASTDLIVLGAQHRRFADTSILGTTTVRVTRHAPCPVLTIVKNA